MDVLAKPEDRHRLIECTDNLHKPWPLANQSSQIVTIYHLAYAQPERGKERHVILDNSGLDTNNLSNRVKGQGLEK